MNTLYHRACWESGRNSLNLVAVVRGLISSSGAKHHKIGMTSNVERRASQHRHEWDEIVVLRGYFDRKDAARDEASLIDSFFNWRGNLNLTGGGGGRPPSDDGECFVYLLLSTNRRRH